MGSNGRVLRVVKIMESEKFPLPFSKKYVIVRGRRLMKGLVQSDF